VARVLHPGGRFAFFLNHPLLRGRGGSTTRSSTRPSSTGASGPTSSRTSRSRRWRRGSSSRSSTGPCHAT
jgi:hypothetical protein